MYVCKIDTASCVVPSTNSFTYIPEIYPFEAINLILDQLLPMFPKRRTITRTSGTPTLSLLIAVGFTFVLISLRSMASKVVPAFSLIVNLEFKEESFKNQFLNDIAPLAKHVKENEPDTLAYEVLLNDKEPLKVMILERYKDKDLSFSNVHRSSKPFQEFRPKLKAMIDEGHVSMEGNSYIDSTVGFGDRVE